MIEEKIFIDKTVQPAEKELKSTIGAPYKYWTDLLKHAETTLPSVTTEWKFYGVKSGWTMKLFSGKRNLLFLMPYEKFFRVGFVFGDKAVAEIEKSDLPEEFISELSSAKKYAEGRGLRIDVKDKSSIDIVKKLLTYKAAK